MVAATLAACYCPSPFAGAFGVTPIRVDLDPASRTGLVTVSNDDERKLHFQVKLFQWTQNAAGEDEYAESGDLLYFPQIFTVEAKDKRIVRIGLKAPPSERERAFRLFIEEMPDPNAASGGGAQVAVRLRFGVPVFLSSGKGEAQAEITSTEASKGAVRIAIRNDGTRQIRFEEIAVRAGDKSIAKTAGWYVFPGVTRVFTVPVAAQDCPVPAAVEIHATADGKDIQRTLEVPPTLCSP
jgi:fimbrial chaperone protein